MKKFLKSCLIFCLLLPLTAGCRKDESVLPSDNDEVTEGENTGPVKGFYLLNEGNMGSNKASLDYFDYETGVYSKNIFPERNPLVTKELGDVGNDIKIYGSKLYAVINCSNLIEVMDARSAKHITSVTVPNCRYIVFNKGYAYVSSYAGPVLIDPNARLGYVAKIDTATFRITDTCEVGYQPEEMVVSENRLFVANSGGYRVPDYDNRVSVIDLQTFKEKKKITVGINLHRMKADGHGNIYVSSRGDYYNTPSKLYILNIASEQVTNIMNVPVSGCTVKGDSLYIFSSEWSYVTNSNVITYAIINTETKSVVSRSFIKDGTEKQIEMPYGLAVNPENGDILITDAKDYITPGKIICYSKAGVKKWEAVTGDIPAHIVFTNHKLN